MLYSRSCGVAEARSHRPRPSRRQTIAAIVIIDDEAQIRLLFRQALEAAGHDVREASTGVEGLRAVCDRPTDLAITDIFMPKWMGWRWCTSSAVSFPRCA